MRYSRVDHDSFGGFGTIVPTWEMILVSCPFVHLRQSGGHHGGALAIVKADADLDAPTNFKSYRSGSVRRLTRIAFTQSIGGYPRPGLDFEWAILGSNQ